MKFTNLPIDSDITRFAEHLKQEGNNKILFSGIFGIEKKYFIDKFLEKKIIKQLEILVSRL